MDKHSFSVADPGSKTLSGHKRPCSIQPPSSEAGEAESVYRVFHLALSGLPSLSPPKENKETTRWPKISLFSPCQGLLRQDYQEPWVAHSQLYIIYFFDYWFNQTASDWQAIKHSSILLKGTSAQSWKKMTHFFHVSGITLSSRCTWSSELNNRMLTDSMHKK